MTQTLAELRARATKGPFRTSGFTAYKSGPSKRKAVIVDKDGSTIAKCTIETNANFIVALVNAFDRGDLVENRKDGEADPDGNLSEAEHNDRPRSEPAGGAALGDVVEDGELLPCPFCGGEAERLDLEDEANFGGSCISCKSCGASSPVHFEFKENLYSSWNARQSSRQVSEGEIARAIETDFDYDHPVRRFATKADWQSVARAVLVLINSRAKSAPAEPTREPMETRLSAAFEHYRTKHYGAYAEYPLDAYTAFAAGFKSALTPDQHKGDGR